MHRILYIVYICYIINEIDLYYIKNLYILHTFTHYSLISTISNPAQLALLVLREAGTVNSYSMRAGFTVHPVPPPYFHTHLSLA